MSKAEAASLVPLGAGRGLLALPPRLLRRVLRRRSTEAALGLHLPHVHVVPCTREELTAALDGERLGCGEALPPRLVLLPTDGGDEAFGLVGRWRLAFHGVIHHVVEERLASGALSPAALRSRIHAIGETEIDEVRFVLRQEELLAERTDAATYTELCALYLELWHFDREALARTFPTLDDADAVLAILRRDVDDHALLEDSRPEGAPDPAPLARTSASVPRTLPASPRSEETARAAETAGNLVRATLYRVSAAGDHDDTLRALARSIELAFQPPTEPPGDLSKDQIAQTETALRALAERAAGSLLFESSLEARLLYDLQRAASRDQRDIQTVDILLFLRSFGRIPVVRTLPLAKDARARVHLRRALERLPRTSLSTAERGAVAPVLLRLSRLAETRLADAVRPRILAVLDEVGLVAKDTGERAARRKLAAELVDTVLARGFFGISQLRDALSRNDLPLPGLTVGKALFGKDPLLAADRAFAEKLDGLYRPGEFYLRLLQKQSALAFGTPVGRFVCLYLVLPLLAAFVVLEGLQHLVGPIGKKLFHVHPHLLTPWSLLGLSLVFFALLHSAAARTAARALLRGIGAVLSAVFVQLPAAILASPPVRFVTDSTLYKLTKQLVVKPLVLSSLVLLGARRFGWTFAAVGGAALFLGWNVLLNTRTGRLLEEHATDTLRRAARHVGRTLLPGIYHAILDGFARLVELLERVLYTVQEYLRFRKGDPRLSLVLKGIASVVWFFTAYVVRLYVNVLIEPQVNPIKHFPVVTVSHKIILPLTPTLLGLFRAPLEPIAGPVVANAVAGPTVVLLPGMFGFLVWELKENFRLYRQNRTEHLAAAVVGSHGETMSGFLIPGFHSGTVPKVYAKMRRAAWRGDPIAEKHRQDLHHVEEACRRFVERDFLALLEEDGVIAKDAWRIDHHDVEVAGNRVRLVVRGFDAEGHQVGRFRLAFEEQSGKLLADLDDGGLLASLPDDDRRTVELFLFGLYARAGVALSRQQIEPLLPTLPDGTALEYDISDEGLVVWAPETTGEVVYDLEAADESLRPTKRGEPGFDAPALPRTELLLSTTPLERAAWERLLALPPKDRPRLVVGPSLLPERSAAPLGLADDARHEGHHGEAIGEAGLAS